LINVANGNFNIFVFINYSLNVHNKSYIRGESNPLGRKSSSILNATAKVQLFLQYRVKNRQNILQPKSVIKAFYIGLEWFSNDHH